MRVTLEAVASLLLPDVPRGRALAPRELQTLVSAAEVLMEGGPHGVSAEDIAESVERFLIAGRSRRAWRVRLLLYAVEISALPRYRRPFSRLTLEERRELILEVWLPGSPHRKTLPISPQALGRICAKVKNLIVLGAYGDPRAAARTGYVPVHRRSRFVDKSRHHEAAGA